MAIEKPLKVRDYLEPRYAAAAGSRLARAARKGLTSFPDVLKNQTARATQDTPAGMTISAYLRSPLLTTQTTRPPRMSGAANASAIGPRTAEAQEDSAAGKSARTLETDRGATPGNAGKELRSSRSTLDRYRAEKASSQPLERAIQLAASKYNLSPELIRSVIRAESNFQADAVSPAGAKGLMQLMPETAKDLGVTNALDIQQNIDGGSRYLRQMLDRFGGDLKLALAAYNAGPGAVEQFQGDVPYAETRQYVKRVLRSAGIKA